VDSTPGKKVLIADIDSDNDGLLDWRGNRILNWTNFHRSVAAGK
jgi:hypothetical protein